MQTTNPVDGHDLEVATEALLLADAPGRYRAEFGPATDQAPHQAGYREAQRAGFALVARLDSVAATMAGLSTYVHAPGTHGEDADDYVENPRFFELEVRRDALAMSVARLHAHRIAVAQGRGDLAGTIAEGIRRADLLAG